MSAFNLLSRCSFCSLPYNGPCIALQFHRTITTEGPKHKVLVQNNRKPFAQRIDLDNLLASPSWSVQSLLPTKDHINPESLISPKKLRHLLRLSALPPPSSEAEEKKMLDVLASQLHFVREMQKVDTDGVEPLRAIRDERVAVEKKQEITMDILKKSLMQEEIVGKHYKRIRRKQDTIPVSRQPPNWHALKQAQRTSGKFFVVDSCKGRDG